MALRAVLTLAAMVPATQTSALLTIPYLTRVFRDDFDSNLWGNWFRVGTYLFALSSILPLACLSSLWLVKAVALTLSCLGVAYNVLFGLRMSQMGICAKDLHSACMESQLTHCGVNCT